MNNTDLADLYRAGQDKALSLEEAIEWTAEIYKIFSQTDITILRVGLHPSESLIKGEQLLAGPFHVSFKELVLTKLWQEKLANIPNNTKTISLNNGVNRKILQEKFPFLKFISDSNVQIGTFIAQN